LAEKIYPHKEDYIKTLKTVIQQKTHGYSATEFFDVAGSQVYIYPLFCLLIR
jgi:hypothetical protein